MRGCPESVGIADRIPSNCVKYYPCSVANSRCVKPVRSDSSRGRVWTNLGSLAQEGLIDKPCDNSDDPCVERLRCRLNQEVVDNNGQVIFDIQEVRCPLWLKPLTAPCLHVARRPSFCTTGEGDVQTRSSVWERPRLMY